MAVQWKCDNKCIVSVAMKWMWNEDWLIDWFRNWNGRYVDSVIHPFHLLPPSIFGFQMWKRKQCISTNGAGPSPLVDHRVCSKDVNIIICDPDVLQGNLVQKVEKVCNCLMPWPIICACNSVFPIFLQCSFVSLWLHIILKILRVVVLMIWCAISLSVVGGVRHTITSMWCVVHPGQHAVHQKCL
jgi:hypothetical protein